MNNGVVREYVVAVAAAVSKEDGPRLATYLSLDKAETRYAQLLVVLKAMAASDIQAAVASSFGSGSDVNARKWQAVVSSHLFAVAELARGNAEASFDAEHAALSDFVQLVNECTTNWQIKPLHCLVRDARRLSVRLEAELAARGAREAASGKIVRFVRTVECECVTDQAA